LKKRATGGWQGKKKGKEKKGLLGGWVRRTRKKKKRGFGVAPITRGEVEGKTRSLPEAKKETHGKIR